MSAVIQNEYTGNGSTTTYSFTFPYLKTSDIKASLDGVDTTAFTLPNATTLQFNTAPTNGAKIKIFRQTSVDNLTATFYAGSAIKSEDLNDNFTQNLYKTQEIGGRFISALGGTMTGNFNMGEDADIVFEGATDNAHETTLTVADPTADRTITLPNVTGTVVTTGDTGTVATGMIAGDAVNGTKIADDSINSEHYVDGSIDTAHIADGQVTTAKITDLNVTEDKIAAGAVSATKISTGAVTTVKLANISVTTGKIAADAITNAKIADNSIDSEHYVDGSIDNAHLADNSITLAKMADDSVGTAELVDGSVVTAALANNSVTLDKMTNNSVGTSEIVDDAVTAAKLASSAVVTASIVDASVTTAKIADDAITNAKLAEDAVGSTELGDGVIDTVHIGSVQVTDAKLASNSVTTAKISDANVTTAKIANDAITIGKLGCEQTTISDSDSHIPTSGAVVDYVAAQLAPLGGFEAIANEQSFPNTQPAAGVVISIADAGGLVVSNSGTASGQTVGGTTVNITGIASNFNGTTVAAGIRFLVASTGSGQNYTYHKATLKEDDLINLSGDINDFAERYRVGSSNPTSSLDNGDLFFNTSTGKMLVYNGTNTAWEEVQSIGNFFISTLSPAFDGSTQDFTITNAPTNAEQILLVINGVVQKPNSGTSTPSEGFALTGNTVKLGAAPATGSTYHAVVIGSTVNIGTPSNNTVSTAILQDDSVTAAKIAAGAVGSTELASNAVITSKIADDAVTSAKIASNSVTNDSINNNSIHGDKLTTQTISLAKFVNGTSSQDGKFLRANNGSAPTFETVNTDLVADTTPQLGGDLDVNTKNIVFGDSSNGSTDDVLKFGATTDLKIYHDGTDSYIDNESGYLYLNNDSSGIRLKSGNSWANGKMAAFYADGAVELYHDNSKKFETANGGVIVTDADTTSSVRLVNTSGTAGYLYGSSNTDFGLLDGQGHWLVKGVKDGKVELRYDNSVRVETTSAGVKLLGSGTDAIEMTGDVWFNNNEHAGADIYFNSGSKHLIFEDNVTAKFGGGADLQIYHNGSNSYVANTTGQLVLEGDDLMFMNSGRTESLARFQNNGAVELYYNDSKKFETTDTGTTTTGYHKVASSNYPAWSLRPNGSSTSTLGNALYKIGWTDSQNSGNNGKTNFLIGGCTISGDSSGNGVHSGTTHSRLVVPVKGVYQVQSTVRIENNPGADNVFLYINGSRLQRQHVEMWSHRPYMHGVINTTVLLEANDYVEIYVRCNGGQLQGYGDTTTWFSGHLVQALT